MGHNGRIAFDIDEHGSDLLRELAARLTELEGSRARLADFTEGIGLLERLIEREAQGIADVIGANEWLEVNGLAEIDEWREHIVSPTLKRN
jgi:hypothetical protein